jgi:hypothetical protein
VLKIVVVHRFSYSDRRRVPLWMTTFRTVTACPSRTSCRRSTVSGVHNDESHHFPSSWRTSVDVWLSDIWSRIGENVSRRDQSHMNTRYEILDWFSPSHRVIVLRPVLLYYIVEKLWVACPRCIAGCYFYCQESHLIDMSNFWLCYNLNKHTFDQNSILRLHLIS